jgi:hypothetical protein
MSLFRLDASIREGWDHATGWMRRVLADVWHLDLKVVEAEFTLVGVNPALDQFTDLARELRRKAEEQARRHAASSAPRSPRPRRRPPEGRAPVPADPRLSMGS